MVIYPPMEEHIIDLYDTSGGPVMELTRSQELIKQLKEIKAKDEITYPRIMERMEKNGKYVSLTTLRRVFSDGSELNANNFSYENTLLPIAEVLLHMEDVPTPQDNPYAKEIDGLKAVIRVQNEEISRLCELKEHLDNRITFLLTQIDKKDAMISKMMEKLL